MLSLRIWWSQHRPGDYTTEPHHVVLCIKAVAAAAVVVFTYVLVLISWNRFLNGMETAWVIGVLKVL